MEHKAPGRESAVAVISAYGAFRLLVALLAVWSFFAGFVLLTQGFGAVGFSGHGPAERVVGGHMIVLAPVYGLIAWRRQAYRLFLWVPYAGQLAIILPLLWALVADQEIGGSALLLVVSAIFFVLLMYVWLNARDIGPFGDGVDRGDELFPEDEERDLDEEEGEPAAADGAEQAFPARPRRYRRTD
jgi:hypothetical protein